MTGWFFTKDSFLHKQEEGGTYRGGTYKNKTGDIPIPASGIRKKHKGVIPKSKRAKKLKDQHEYFYCKLDGIVYKRKPGEKIEPMWIFRDSADYDPMLHMYQITKQQAFELSHQLLQNHIRYVEGGVRDCIQVKLMVLSLKIVD